MKDHPRVVIVGGGFGGLCAARALPRRPFEITLIDRRNHHLFQPLLYQVATGGLSPANIAAPLRALVKGRQQTRVRLGEVTGFDLEQRLVHVGGDSLPYDYLIVAAGAGQSYFGRPEWAEQAPGLKTLEDATKIRRRVLGSFEQAELETDPERIKALLTFVVVGAGPTGVELAGALAEVAKRTLKGEFRNIDPGSARVLLVEGASRVLPPFSPQQSRRAHASLERLGVTVLTDTKVTAIDPGKLELSPMQESAGAPETVYAETILWAAGVEASPLGAALAAQSDAALDRSGRVMVAADCSLPGRPEVFVIGDLGHYVGEGGQPLPGLAPVAMQQGRYVAKLITARHEGKSFDRPFRYTDKGNMAVIGRRMAVAEISKLRFWGGPAWLAWLFIHLMYLAEFQNRVLVLVQWAFNYFTRNRSARLISETLELPSTPKPAAEEKPASPRADSS